MKVKYRIDYDKIVYRESKRYSIPRDKTM